MSLTKATEELIPKFIYQFLTSLKRAKQLRKNLTLIQVDRTKIFLFLKTIVWQNNIYTCTKIFSVPPEKSLRSAMLNIFLIDMSFSNISHRMNNIEEITFLPIIETFKHGCAFFHFSNRKFISSAEAHHRKPLCLNTIHASVISINVIPATYTNSELWSLSIETSLEKIGTTGV